MSVRSSDPSKQPRAKSRTRYKHCWDLSNAANALHDFFVILLEWLATLDIGKPK